MSTTGEVTGWLQAWRTKGPEALEQLLPLVYGDMRTLARRQLASERAGHTLQPTDLVHEVYLRLASGGRPRWVNRRQFFAVATRLMRTLLIDHARARSATKRGGARCLVPLATTMTEPAAAGGAADGSLARQSVRRQIAADVLAELLALEDSLARLAAFDARKCKTIQLRYLAGMTIDETASTLGVSTATVILDTRLARAWLHRDLSRS